VLLCVIASEVVTVWCYRNSIIIIITAAVANVLMAQMTWLLSACCWLTWHYDWDGCVKFFWLSHRSSWSHDNLWI